MTGKKFIEKRVDFVILRPVPVVIFVVGRSFSRGLWLRKK